MEDLEVFYRRRNSLLWKTKRSFIDDQIFSIEYHKVFYGRPRRLLQKNFFFSFSVENQKIFLARRNVFYERPADLL